MNWPLPSDVTILLSAIFLILGIVLLITIVLIFFVIWYVRRIELPPGADFLTALKATPFIVVVILDLLDLSLDIFSAPITWFLLGRLGLGPLRGVAVVKDLIPFTNFIPAMTLAWLFARYVANDERLLRMENLTRLHR